MGGHTFTLLRMRIRELGEIQLELPEMEIERVCLLRMGGIRPLPPRPDRAQHITQIVNLCLMPLPSSSPSMSPHLAANASTVA